MPKKNGSSSRAFHTTRDIHTFQVLTAVVRMVTPESLQKNISVNLRHDLFNSPERAARFAYPAQYSMQRYETLRTYSSLPREHTSAFRWINSVAICSTDQSGHQGAQRVARHGISETEHGGRRELRRERGSESRKLGNKSLEPTRTNARTQEQQWPLPRAKHSSTATTTELYRSSIK